MHTAGRRAVLALAALTLLVASVSGCAFHGHHYQTAEESDSQGFTQLLEVATESQVAPRSIKGKIKLNGQFYQTSCQCSDAAMTSSCNPPFRLHVHQEAINQDVGLSKRELRKLLGPPTSFQLREVEKINFACTDGREGRGILGTPGGDFVEFLSALQLYEFLTNSTFTQPKIKEYLVDWLLMSPSPMYYHTDEQARSLLERNVMINGIRGIVGLDLENPIQEQQSEVLKELVKGAHQGCYVIKALLATPDRFYLRKELIEGLITSLYEVLWDKKRMGPDGPLHKKIDFVILSGTPTEKAWINFRGNYRCEDEHKSPIFTPKGLNDTQVFVNHPEAVGVLRTMLSRYFLTRTPPALVSLPEFLGYLNRQGLFIMEAIAEILAGNRMPFYTVQVE